MATQPFCGGLLSDAKVLVIGHDPRLQQSDTLAEYALFGDYFFRSKPTHGSELRKYGLAAAVYSYVDTLTGSRYPAEHIALTNLCNVPLAHAPKGKTVLIPPAVAKQGMDGIRALLSRTQVELIFAMSQQVNYWLQYFGFYPAVEAFMQSACPRQQGIDHLPPYYQPVKNRAFLNICGQCYHTNDQRVVVPILHVKNWPLTGRFTAYQDAYAEYWRGMRQGALGQVSGI